MACSAGRGGRGGGGRRDVRQNPAVLLSQERRVLGAGISRAEYQKGGSYTEKLLQKSGGPLDSVAQCYGSYKRNSRAITRLGDSQVQAV